MNNDFWICTSEQQFGSYGSVHNTAKETRLSVLLSLMRAGVSKMTLPRLAENGTYRHKPPSNQHQQSNHQAQDDKQVHLCKKMCEWDVTAWPLPLYSDA